MARILVTGASGFIGSHLVQLGKEEGHDLRGLSRRGGDGPGWRLGEPIPPVSLSGIDYAVHLAHDFNGELGASQTVQGTLSAIDEIRQAGARRQIFFSSLSARPDAVSLYGRTKFEIERKIASAPDIVIVRPGLVLGAGGIYGRIQNWVRKWPVAPLPDGGRGLIRVIGLDELCHKALSILLLDGIDREFNLFDLDPVSLRELVRQEAARMNKRVLILPISSRLLMSVLHLVEGLGLNSPVNADNLAGFLANQSDFHQQSNAR